MKITRSMYKLTALTLLIAILIGCSNSSNDEYQLSPELKAKAKAMKEAKKRSEGEVVKLTQETSPAWVAEQIFLAANTGDASVIEQICDPVNTLEGKAKRLCDIPLTPKNEQERFMEYFKTGRVDGEPIIDGNQATVKILIGYNGAAPETLTMIKREGKWYLSSF